MTERTPVNDQSTIPSRTSCGLTIIGAAILMVGVMAVHPESHAHDFAGLVATLAEIATFNGAVHGTAIAATGVAFLGFWGLAQRLGMGSTLVRAGLVAYGVGSTALIGAASINGFVICRLAQQLKPGDEAGLERLRPLLALCRVGNETCDHLGVMAWSAAVALWSIVMIHRAGAARPLGLFGLLVAVAPPVALMAGHLPMSVHGFGAFVLLQAIWSVWAGVQLVRGRL